MFFEGTSYLAVSKGKQKEHLILEAPPKKLKETTRFSPRLAPSGHVGSVELPLVELLQKAAGRLRIVQQILVVGLLKNLPHLETRRLRCGFPGEKRRLSLGVPSISIPSRHPSF